MNALWCHRCQAELPAHEDGALVFCAHCGAPQVRLSEELRERSEAATPTTPELTSADANGIAATTTDAPRDYLWRDALRFVLVSAAMCAGLALLSAVASPLLLLGWLWAAVSPIVLLGVLQARKPQVAMTTGFGARLGFVTGLGNATAVVAMYIAAIFVARRAHVLGEFDKSMEASFHAMQAQVAAQAAGQAGGAGLQWLQSADVPEFRAGILLAGLAMLTGLLLFISTAGGAFAGFMRSRRAS